MAITEKYLKLHGISVDKARKAQKISLLFLLASEIAALLAIIYFAFL